MLATAMASAIHSEGCSLCEWVLMAWPAYSERQKRMYSQK